MSWARQVLHLLARDLRRARLAWGAYALTTVAGVAIATERVVAPSADTVPLVLVLLLVGSMVAMLAILADSAVRPDAFWATLPVRASAAAAAKLVQLALLVALPLAAAALLLAGAGHGTRAIATMLLVTGGALGAWYGAIAVVASASRDAREAIAGSLGLVVALVALFLTGFARSWEPASAWWSLPGVKWGAVVACVLIVAWRYRRRGMGLVPRLATGVAAVAIAWASVVPSTPRAEAQAATVVATMPSDRVQLDTTRPIRCLGDAVEVWVRDDPGEGRMLTIGGATLSLVTRDGTTLEAEASGLQGFGAIGLATGPAAPPFANGSGGGTMRFALPVDSRARCMESVRASLRYFGRWSEGRETARLPWRDGAALDAPGTRLVLRFDTAAGTAPRVTRTELRPSFDDDMSGFFDRVFVFDDPGRDVRTVLGDRSAMPAMADLPGITRRRYVHTLEPRTSPLDDSLALALRAPSSQASLVVLAPVDVAAGSVRTPPVRIVARAW